MVLYLKTVQYQPAPILTERFLRETYTGTISMKSGKRNSRISETGAGPGPGSVKIVPYIQIVREMDCITGTGIRKMYWFATTRKLIKP